MNEIDELKIRLYLKLSEKVGSKLTNNEIDIFYLLSKDPAIQNKLKTT